MIKCNLFAHRAAQESRSSFERMVRAFHVGLDFGSAQESNPGHIGGRGVCCHHCGNVRLLAGILFSEFVPNLTT